MADQLRVSDLAMKSGDYISYRPCLDCPITIEIDRIKSKVKNCTKRFSLCLDCPDHNKCSRYIEHRSKEK
jgi:hypothetical protein